MRPSASLPSEPLRLWLERGESGYWLRGRIALADARIQDPRT